MAKHSLEFKHKVIKHCLLGVEGTKTVAKRFEINRTTLRRWVEAYKVHGTGSLSARHQPYSIEFKYQAIQSVLDGSMTINEALAHYNIPANTSLLSWIRLYNEGGIDALQTKPRGRPRMSKQEKSSPVSANKPLQEMTREELLEELEDRHAEVACLKKLKALVQSGQLAIKPKR
jgi:transposase